MINLILLGTGNVATHLFRAFSTSGDMVRVTQVYNHSPAGLAPFAKTTPVTSSLSEIYDADIYLIALKDDVIPDVARELCKRDALIAHTSGSVPLSAIPGNSRAGVFYPLQTFSRDREIQYGDIPFCIEATNNQDLDLLKQLAKHISGKAIEVSSEQRKKLHLAAVFVCNFVNSLYTIGEHICNQNELPFEILKPLIRETAAKVQEASPAEMQTGPAVRNDQSTIQAHLDLLQNQELKNLYKDLTHAIQSLHGKKL